MNSALRRVLIGLALLVVSSSGAAGAEWRRDAVRDPIRQSALIRAMNPAGATFVVTCRSVIGVTDWVIGARGPLPEDLPRSRLSDEAVILVDGAELRWPKAFGLRIGKGEIRAGRQLVVGPYDPPWIKQTMEAFAKGRTLTFRFKLSGHEWSWPLTGFAGRYGEGGFEPCTGS